MLPSEPHVDEKRMGWTSNFHMFCTVQWPKIITLFCCQWRSTFICSVIDSYTILGCSAVNGRIFLFCLAFYRRTTFTCSTVSGWTWYSFYCPVLSYNISLCCVVLYTAQYYNFHIHLHINGIRIQFSKQVTSDLSPSRLTKTEQTCNNSIFTITIHLHILYMYNP